MKQDSLGFYEIDMQTFKLIRDQLGKFHLGTLYENYNKAKTKLRVVIHKGNKTSYIIENMSKTELKRLISLNQ